MPTSAPRTTNCPALITQSTANATTLAMWPPKARASHGAAAATSTTCTAGGETAGSRAGRSGRRRAPRPAPPPAPPPPPRRGGVPLPDRQDHAEPGDERERPEGAEV